VSKNLFENGFGKGKAFIAVAEETEDFSSIF
jgi:hypothetical protein